MFDQGNLHRLAVINRALPDDRKPVKSQQALRDVANAAGLGHTKGVADITRQIGAV